MELLSLVDSGIRVSDPVLEYHDQDFDLSEFFIDQIPTCDHNSNCSYATSLMDMSGRGSKSFSNSIDDNWHLVDGDFTSPPPTGFYGDSGKGLVRANDDLSNSDINLVGGSSSFGPINSGNSLSSPTSHKPNNNNYVHHNSHRSTYINGNINIPTENIARRVPKRRKILEESKEIPNYITYETPNAKAIMQVKEMIYRAAVLRPVNLGPETPVEKPKRKNMKISKEPQTVAARQRRERVGERIRVLGRLVPGGTKMDTATMLEEAANYLNFLKSQLANSSPPTLNTSFYLARESNLIINHS